MSDTRLLRLAPNEPSNWPEALTRPATFTALDAWLDVAHSTYGFPIYRFETRRKGRVTAIMAMAHIRHPVFGDYLITSPFGSYGGFAYTDVESRDLLLEKARRLAAELKAQYANVRFDAGDQVPPHGWIQHPIYSTYLLDLPLQPDALFPNFASHHRNHIRKSLRKGFTITFGHLDLLHDAYEVLARSMHELGSPYHGISYLKTLAESLGERLEFAVLYDPHGKLAGAGVFILHGHVVANLHANILRAFRSDYAGECLYWRVIERYTIRGFKVLDLGRSLIGSGNEIFKMKWKPRKRPLAYWYALQPGAEIPALNPKNPKFATAIWMWKHLPTFVVRRFGPFLIRGLA